MRHKRGQGQADVQDGGQANKPKTCCKRMRSLQEKGSSLFNYFLNSGVVDTGPSLVVKVNAPLVNSSASHYHCYSVCFVCRIPGSTQGQRKPGLLAPPRDERKMWGA
jgi:hypothetical protein